MTTSENHCWKRSGFEQRVAELLGLALGVVEDQPATGEKIAVQVVKVVAFEADIDVALVGVAGVVGVLPLAPVVLFVQLLRHVPAAHCWVEDAEHDVRSLGRKGGLVALLQP